MSRAPASSLRARVIAGVSWLAVAQGGQRLLNLLTAAVLARMLPPADFGLIAMAFVCVNLVGVAREVGIAPSIVQRPVVTDAHLDAGFWMNLGAALLLYGIGAMLGPVLGTAMHDARVVPVTLVLLLAVPLTASGQLSDALLQRRLEFRRIAAIEVGSSVASGITGLALAFAGAGVWALVGQNLAFALALTIGRLVAAGWWPRLRFDRARARDLLGFSANAFGCAITTYGMRNADNFIIGAMLGSAALGYYALAYNLMLLPGYLVTGVAGRVVFPALASLRDDPPRMRAAYLRATRVLATLAFPAVAGMAVIAPLIVGVAYGPQWGPSVPILQVLCLVGMFEAINCWGIVFYALGRPELLLRWYLADLVVMTLAFAVGVRWGAMGVAGAYAVVAPFTLGAPHLHANRLLGLRLAHMGRAILPAAAAAAAMALLVHAAATTRTIGGLPTVQAAIALVALGALSYAAIMGLLALAFGRRSGYLSWLGGLHMVRS